MAHVAISVTLATDDRAMRYGDWKDWLLCLGAILFMQTPSWHSSRWRRRHPAAETPALQPKPQATDPKKSNWHRLLDFLEQPFFLAVLGIIGGIVGVIVSTPIFLVCDICVLLALHRSKAVADKRIVVQVFWYSVAFILMSAILVGVSIGLRNSARNFVHDIASAISEIIKPQVANEPNKPSADQPKANPAQSAPPSSPRTVESENSSATPKLMDPTIVKGWGGPEGNQCQALVDGAKIFKWGDRYKAALICGIDDPTTDRDEDEAVTVSSPFTLQPSDMTIAAPLSDRMVDKINKMPTGSRYGTWIMLFLIPKTSNVGAIHKISDISKNGGFSPRVGK